MTVTEPCQRCPLPQQGTPGETWTCPRCRFEWEYQEIAPEEYDFDPSGADRSRG